MHIEQNCKRYFLSTVTIKDYNVMTDDRRTYGNLRKITTGQADDYTTYSKSSHPKVLLVKDVLKICSKFSEHFFLRTLLSGFFCHSRLHYVYFQIYYKMIAIDFSKQQALDADLKAIQRINFTRNLQSVS